MTTRTPMAWRSGTWRSRQRLRVWLRSAGRSQWRALSRRLGIEPEEPRRWLRVARDLYTGFDEQTGLFEQFRGYFGLEEIDLAAFVPRTAPMDVLLGRERIQRSKIIKQPDVVMLVHLLWERMPPEVRKANFEYYEPRCGHGSSLSPAIHALVAARLGETSRWRSVISGKQPRSTWRTTWGTRLVAFTPPPSADYGRPRCSALLACASAERSLSIARTCRQAGAACRCAFSGGADGTSSRFRKAAETSESRG